MFKKLKKEKAQEIVMLLDLFEGKVTLTELLETDIPIINQLRDAKLELKQQQEVVAARAVMENAPKQSSLPKKDK